MKNVQILIVAYSCRSKIKEQSFKTSLLNILSSIISTILSIKYNRLRHLRSKPASRIRENQNQEIT